MFVNFLFELKRAGVPVSLTEWMTLMEALSKGLASSSLSSFYYLARSVLVKSEALFDNYDQAFHNYFQEIETPDDLVKFALKWIEYKKLMESTNPDDIAMDDEYIRKLRKDLVGFNMEFEKKDEGIVSPTIKGGSGSAQSGQGGFNPQGGIRIGGSPSGGSAVKVAGERVYRGYRSDVIIGVRRFEAALRVLRQLTREDGLKDELDLDGTIDATSRNGGRLEIVWNRPRKNKLKILLVMDSGGSMDSYINLCSQLFTAVKRATHFKDLQYYYFHNCIYDKIYVKPACVDVNAMLTSDFLQRYNSDYRLIIVGDASMAPLELTAPGGAIDVGYENREPGIIWIDRLARHFRHAVWINPVPAKSWDERKNYRAQTISMIRTIIPMYELSLDGLNEAVKKLKSRIR